MPKNNALLTKVFAGGKLVPYIEKLALVADVANGQDWVAEVTLAKGQTNPAVTTEKDEVLVADEIYFDVKNEVCVVLRKHNPVAAAAAAKKAEEDARKAAEAAKTPPAPPAPAAPAGNTPPPPPAPPIAQPLPRTGVDKDLTLAEVLAAGYSQEAAPGIVESENRIRVRARELVAGGLNADEAYEKAVGESKAGAPEGGQP